jgi:hypothetical protein
MKRFRVVVGVVWVALIIDAIGYIKVTLRSVAKPVWETLEPFWLVMENSSNCDGEQSVDRQDFGSIMKRIR